MKSELSARELEVLTLATDGFTDDMIAGRLGIERGTVNNYWVRIRGKLGHLSRTKLVARFVKKNADSDHADEVARMDAVAESTAADNAKILASAHAEIERLKGLLRKERG